MPQGSPATYSDRAARRGEWEGGGGGTAMERKAATAVAPRQANFQLFLEL